MVFKNAEEVEEFKLRRQLDEVNAELAEVNARLKPLEDELREKHRKMWGY